MTTVINWNVSQLDCLPQAPEGADYVVTAHWQCNGVDKDATEAAVEQQIQNQINPPIVTPPLPWAS